MTPIKPEAPFRLNAADRHTGVWMAIRDHYTAKLARLRTQNDGDRDEAATAKLRGQIAEIKSLLDLDKDLPALN